MVTHHKRCLEKGNMKQNPIEWINYCSYWQAIHTFHEEYQEEASHQARGALSHHEDRRKDDNQWKSMSLAEDLVLILLLLLCHLDFVVPSLRQHSPLDYYS